MGFLGEDELDEEEAIQNLGYSTYGGASTEPDPGDPWSPSEEVEEQDRYEESVGGGAWEPDPWSEPGRQESSSPVLDFEEAYYGGGGYSPSDEVEAADAYEQAGNQYTSDYSGDRYDSHGGRYDEDEDEEDEEERVVFRGGRAGTGASRNSRYTSDTPDEEIEEDVIGRQGLIEDTAQPFYQATQREAANIRRTDPQLSDEENARAAEAAARQRGWIEADYEPPSWLPTELTGGRFGPFSAELPYQDEIASVYRGAAQATDPLNLTGRVTKMNPVIPDFSAGDVGEMFAPRTVGELGLEFVPGIGSVPDAFRAARGGLRASGAIADEAIGAIGRNFEPSQPLGRLAREETGAIDLSKLPGSGAPFSEGDAVLSLRAALREGLGQQRADIVAQGRKRQAARIGGSLDVEAEGGATGLDLARRAGQAGAGGILPEGGIGFKLADEAIDPLVQKALRLQQEGKISIFDAVYNVPKAIDEGRRLGPTPAQAKLLSKLTDIDEAEFANYVRQRRIFDASNREAINEAVAQVGQDAPALVRASLQAAKRAEMQADRAASLGKAEQAATLRAKAAAHQAKAEKLQVAIDVKAKQTEIQRLARELDHAIAGRANTFNRFQQFKEDTIVGNERGLKDFKDAYLKRESKIAQLGHDKTVKELEAAQEAFDRAQQFNPVQAAKQEQEISQRLISQLQPPDASPARIQEQLKKTIESLGEGKGLPEEAKMALEILRYHEQGNRAILDSIKNSEGLGQLMAGIRASATGELADSHLTTLMYRNFALGHALTEAGLDPAMIKKVSNASLNFELKTRYGDNVPPRILHELETMKGAAFGDSLAGVDKAVQRWKNVAFGIDAGVFGVQVRTAVRRGGINMLAGTINQMLNLLHLPHITTHMSDVALSKRLRNIVDGVHVGMGNSPLDTSVGTPLSYLGAPGRALDDRIVTPALERINRLQFGNVMGWVGDNAYEGNLVMLRLLGRDINNPRVRAEAANVANTIKSFANTALRSGKGGIERKLLTSASMTRSQVTNLLQMGKLLEPGASAEQRILAATLIASQATTYLLVGKFLNDQIGITDFVFSPGESGFGAITTGQKDSNGRNIVVDMFPQASLERVIGRSLSALVEGDEQEAADAWFKYFSGRASVVGRVPLALAGTGYSQSRGFVKDLSVDERLGALLPTPPILSSILSEGFDAARAALDFIGFSNYPESDSYRTDRERDAVAMERHGMTYAELLADPNLGEAAQRAIDADPRVSGWKEGADQDFNARYPAIGEVRQANDADRQAVIAGGAEWMQAMGLRSVSELDAELAAGRIDGPTYREEIDKINDALFARRLTREGGTAYQQTQASFGERTGLDEAEQAQKDYFDMTRGKGSFEEYEKALAEWQAKYPQYTKGQVAPSAEPFSQTHAELQQVRKKVDEAGWFDAYDNGYAALRNAAQNATTQQAQTTKQLLGPYETYDDFKVAADARIKAALEAQNKFADRDAIDAARYKIEQDIGLTKVFNVAQAQVLVAHPNIYTDLVRWYDIDPGELKEVAELQRAANPRITPEGMGAEPALFEDQQSYLGASNPANVSAWQRQGEAEQRPVGANLQAQFARTSLERMGIPGELVDIAADITEGPGQYAWGPSDVGFGDFTPGPGQISTPNQAVDPYGQASPAYTVVHESLHAFEGLLTPAERQELLALMAQELPQRGGPATHHPYSGDPRVPVTGLTAYFDYMNEPGHLQERGNMGAVAAIPTTILQFIREMTPIVHQRSRGLQTGTLAPGAR